jgi:hypothetical protein
VYFLFILCNFFVRLIASLLLECRAWLLECRAWLLECRAWLLECRAWLLECRAWLLEGRAWLLEGRASLLECRACHPQLLWCVFNFFSSILLSVADGFNFNDTFLIFVKQ